MLLENMDSPQTNLKSNCQMQQNRQVLEDGSSMVLERPESSEILFKTDEKLECVEDDYQEPEGYYITSDTDDEHDDEVVQSNKDISSVKLELGKCPEELSNGSIQRNKGLDELICKNQLKVKQRKKRKRFLAINVSSCKYQCVRRVCRRFGFREVEDGEDWCLYWTDFSVNLERVIDMKKYQKINHFPGMSEICRKDLLARNMNRLWKQFPKDYAIFPRTWCLPADFGDFQTYCRSKKNKTYILKPDSGSQGKGIFLTKNPKDIKPGEDLICQQYVSKPFLIDGFKFDLRVYVLVTSCDPLRLFVFKDGLARFSTVQYVEPTNNNLENIYMHLTNYAIQKNSDEFIRDEDSGSKRRLSVVNKWFQDNNYDVNEIWSRIDDVIIKTLISAHPTLKHNYRTCFPNHMKSSACFEILGFDIILDRKLKPWILEVNHSPSFTTDSKLDREIKDSLIHDTLVLVNFSFCDKRKYIEEERRKVRERLLSKTKDQKDKKDEFTTEKETDFFNSLKKYEDLHLGNFRRIFPENNEDKYEEFFSNSCSLFQETAASKARSECARIQREEIKQKSEWIDLMRRKNGCKFVESTHGLRPESGSRPRQLRTSMLKRLTRVRDLNMNKRHEFNSLNPHPINEREELERIGSITQRDNLLRTLGIPDFVYRLLHGSKPAMEKNPPASCNHDDDSSKQASKSLPAMQTCSVPQTSTTTRSHVHDTYSNKSNISNTQSAMFDSTAKHHWATSRPPALSRKDRQILVSAGIDFTPAVQSKVLPKRAIPFAKTGSCDQAENKRNSIIDKNRNIDNFNRVDYLSYERNSCFNTINRQISCSILRSSPPIKLFKDVNSKPVFCGTRGLSIISSPAPLQIREDALLHQPYGNQLDRDGFSRRSTRAQRIRGATNNLRIKQMELLESRTVPS